MREALARAPGVSVPPIPEELATMQAYEAERRDPSARHFSQDEAEDELERLLRSRSRAMDR